MTKTEFVDLVNANGGPECVLTVICDNEVMIRYIDNEHILNLDADIVTIGGVDYIKHYSKIEDKRPEKRPTTKHVITTYHPMEIVQGVAFIQSAEERQFLDRSVMFDVYE